MGTLERIRQVGPYALGTFAFVFILFMVLSDANINEVMNQNNNPQTAAIAEIEGEEILNKDYEEEVKLAEDQQRKQQGPDAEIDYLTLRNQIWQEITERTLIKKAAEKNGIYISDDIIAEFMLENPPEYLKTAFTDSAGVFRRDLYLNLVTKPNEIIKVMFQDPAQVPEEQKREAVENFKKDLILVESFIRRQRNEQELTLAVNTAGGILSPTMIKEKYVNENSFADFAYLKFDLSMVADEEIKITDEELTNHYNKNKQYYKQKTSRKLKYINFPLIPNAQDSVRANKRVQDIMSKLLNAASKEEKDNIFQAKFDELNGTVNDFALLSNVDPQKLNSIAGFEVRDVVGPVKLADGTYFFRVDDKRTGENAVVKASHILISLNDNKDSAKAEADKIYKMATSGKDFAELAKSYSKDPGSGSKGGDLGFFGKGQMVASFEEAAFAANIGDITKPVESQFGYHIIKVYDKQSDEIKFSEIKIRPVMSGPTKNSIFRDAKSFAIQLNEGKNFDTLASTLNINSIETAFFEKGRSILGSNYVSDFAFENKLGAVIDPIEIKGYGVVVAQVSAVQQDGLMTFEEAKEKVQSELMKSKKLDKLNEKAMAVYNNIKNVGNLQTAIVPKMQVQNAANVSNNGSIPGIGRDMVLSTKVMMLDVNKISEPIRGEIGVYIIQIQKRKIPTEQEVTNNVGVFKESIYNQLKSSTYYSWFNDYKKIADFKDFRFKFSKEY